ncbi:hypothetical protein MPH_09788 [Macrophomina phaseolina MS6]|uniref:Uncharacterized protein n=1 Tax=Macrophomina phaseolina (strain MS6) TaxID=1126212 RepID=K2REQ1_MACPH|nr:hypothetical protein MPH_09788 [Macrophomina phaseolina MS6]
MAPCLIVTSTHHRNLLKQQPKMPSTTLPWWQVNVPEDLRTEECPDFLRECGEKDRRIIGTPDSEYRPYGWEEVKDIVKTNRIDKFVRKPSELRRYRHYTWELVRNYGSIMDFVLKERLKWGDLTPQGPPFTHPGLYCCQPRLSLKLTKPATAKATSRSCTTTGPMALTSELSTWSCGPSLSSRMTRRPTT